MEITFLKPKIQLWCKFFDTATNPLSDKGHNWRHNATNLMCYKPYKVTNVLRDKPNNATNVISNKHNNLTKVTNVISDIAYDFCCL